MAESKLGNSGLSVEEEEEFIRLVSEVKEKEGNDALHRFLVNKMMELEEKATGGDNSLYWMEANSIESAERIDALDAELCEFRGECGKLVAEWCLNNGVPKGQAVEDALFEQLGLFTDECQVLLEEYAKSAAEFCIKKLRVVSLVDKHAKKSRLMIEIEEAREISKEYVDIFEVFTKSSSLLKELQQMKQERSHARVIDQENEVGGAPVKSPETARVEIKILESALSNEKLERAIVDAFLSESARVVVELMRGVEVEGQKPVEVSDDAMELGKEWMEAMMDVCLVKVWSGIMVERLSVFEVLKREIAVNWKIEKYVMGLIPFYQRKNATDIVEEEIAKVGPHSQGDHTITEKNSGRDALVEAYKNVEAKKRWISMLFLLVALLLVCSLWLH